MYKMRQEEIKVLAEKYADELSGEGDYFEEIEKAYALGANKYLSQLEIEESQNEMLIRECEDLKSVIVVSEHKVKELTEAVEWALNNCKPERDELHSDFFNILTNALNVPE